MFNINIIWQRDCPNSGTTTVNFITHKCVIIVLLEFEKYSGPDDQSLSTWKNISIFALKGYWFILKFYFQNQLSLSRKSILIGLKILFISKLHLVLQNSQRAPFKNLEDLFPTRCYFFLVDHRLDWELELSNGEAAAWRRKSRTHQLCQGIFMIN